MKGLKGVAIYNITMKTTPKQIGDLPDELSIVIQDFIRPTATDMERFRRKNILSNNKTEFTWYDASYYYSNIIIKIQNYLIEELSDPDVYVNEYCIERQFNSGYNNYLDIFSYDDQPPSDIESNMFCLKDINAIMGFLSDMDLTTDGTFEHLINQVVCFMALEFSTYIFDADE
jgi:hypothetical protein